MSLVMPNYIKSGEVDNDPIQHSWDESTSEELLLDYPRLTERLSAVSYRCLLAFSLGSAEWVVWRLSRHFADLVPFQVVEACWAGTIDWRYLKSLDVPNWEEQLPAPIGGPLNLAFWLLQTIFVAARRLEPFWQSSASVSELALRILSMPDQFKVWRRFVVDRLTRLHPKQQKDRLGTPVPREALDPNFDYNPDVAPELLRRFLKNLNPSQNPYLSSPEEMIADGFVGTPYLL